MSPRPALCRSFADTILDFVQGRCTPDQQAALESHIDACEECRMLVSATAMSPLVSLAAPVPESLSTRILRPVRRRLGNVSGSVQTATLEPRTEEERAVLQRRIVLLSAILAALSGAALVFSFCVIVAVAPALVVDYARSPHQLISMVWVLALAVAWRKLSRTPARLSFAALRVIDAAGMVAVACFMAGNSTLENADRGGALTTALSVGHLMIVRSIVVPSEGLRTLGNCALCVAGTLACQAATLRLVGAEARHMTTGAVLGVTALWLSISTIMATITSRVLFGLRGETARLRVAGQYHLHEKIGEGSMGAVYRATHSMLRRPAAIKLLLPRKSHDSLGDFEEEVQQTARLRHPNTIAIFDYGRTVDGVFYYAMEYVEGKTLQCLVEEAGPLPPGRVVHILDQVLGSLSEAHGLRLLHRDIKPANVMVLGVVAPDTVKVLDFGLVQDLARSPREDSGGRLVGTPAYIAPERLLPGGAVGIGADLYSVAALAYFLLTGTTLFRAATVREMLKRQVNDEPEHPASRLGGDVPETLASLIMRALAKDPSARPASAAEFRDALRACQITGWSETEAREWWTHALAIPAPGPPPAQPLQTLDDAARGILRDRDPRE